MIEPRAPIYAWGQPVRATVDLFNDGSYPDVDEGALLVRAGSLGEVVQVGHHAEANLPVYMVEFGRTVVGCLEEELERAAPATAAVSEA
ncbi:nitrogen fixation protein NifZ [Ideonella sp. 4Y16]|uniref:Nitrogen fixation protein NifZ n=2 Tax=Ideonella TaxID=36862 RepID=A0A940YQP3_9BURK|nr:MULTISPECIES: nitrogen fixation protein NifZ [Ideonella]MBQ0933066.1 nitrogen fixation protein NifZ [Ideonella alba]MBQ0945854.1 nitrogen fixation protein NifZ [Ideonella alba]MBQ0961162.1 nitrogen fixation protein NifZ [Ideonella aquatica]